MSKTKCFFRFINDEDMRIVPHPRTLRKARKQVRYMVQRRVSLRVFNC